MTTEQIETLKPLVDKLSPTLNAYLRSIGSQETAKNKGQITKDKSE